MHVATRVWVGVSLGLAVVAGLVFYFFFYDARLTIVPTPSNADVFINDQAVTSAVPIKLKPGTYHITVKTTGYLSSKATVKLSISDIKTLPMTLRQIPSPQPVVGSVQFPAMTPDQRGIVYLGLQGKQFFRVETTVGADGRPRIQPISEARFSNLSNVVWSPDRGLAIIQTTDGKTQLFDFQRYDFVHQEQRDIQNDLRSVAWNPNPNIQQIVAFESAPAGDRSLMRWDVANSQFERLADLRPFQLTNPLLSWSPDGKWIALVQNGVFLYNTATREVHQVPGTEGVLAANWSPNSKVLLVELDTSLALVDPNQTASGGRLGLRTPVGKTTWTNDGTGIVAALATANGLDELELIDATTAMRKAYKYQSTGTINMGTLMLTKDSSQVWFASQGTLYSLLLELDHTGR